MAGGAVPLLALDHLVLAARTLAQGLDWCEATLGIRPEAGGRHALMGTHNRVFAIGSARFPRAYFEVIATDPAAPPPQHARWFALDDAALQHALVRGPQWVARCASLDATRAALLASGLDGGEPRPAELAAALPEALERDPRAGASPISVTLAGTHGPVTLETPNLGA